MRRAARKVLAMLGVCTLVAACSGANAISGDENYEGTQYLRRWKITDASGNTLSQGCAKEPETTPSADYWATRIKVHAAAGSVITDQDNVGSEQVSKSRTGQQLPTSDAYWCSDQDTTTDGSAVYGLGTLHVVGTDPPAALQSVALVNPKKDSHGDLVAEGMKAQLQILHPGVLQLGYSIHLDAADGGTDGGQTVEKTFTAMTIE